MTLYEANKPVDPLLDDNRLAVLLSITLFDARLLVKEALIDLNRIDELSRLMLCSHTMARRIIDGKMETDR